MHVDGPMQQSPYSARMDYKLKPGVDRAKVVALRQALDDMGSHLTTVYYQDWKDPDRLTWSVIFVPWGKSGAIEHLQQKLALTGGVIAGDSGNDLDALMVESVGADFLRVLVGRLQYDADVDDLLAELNVNDTEGRTLFRGCKDSDRVFYVEGKESLRYGPDSIFRAMRMAGFRWQIQQMI